MENRTYPPTRLLHQALKPTHPTHPAATNLPILHVNSDGLSNVRRGPWVARGQARRCSRCSGVRTEPRDAQGRVCRECRVGRVGTGGPACASRWVRSACAYACPCSCARWFPFPFPVPFTVRSLGSLGGSGRIRTLDSRAALFSSSPTRFLLRSRFGVPRTRSSLPWYGTANARCIRQVP